MDICNDFYKNRVKFVVHEVTCHALPSASHVGVQGFPPLVFCFGEVILRFVPGSRRHKLRTCYSQCWLAFFPLYPSSCSAAVSCSNSSSLEKCSCALFRDFSRSCSR